MAAAWNDLPVTGGLNECAALVRSAEALRVSAPELAVQLARRALLLGATDSSANSAGAGEARMLAMRAQAVLAGGLVRVSQHVNAVEPGFAALALAESGGAPDVAAEVRLDLAACAQELGEPLLGGALLRPVLEDGQAPPSVRAAALGRLVGCVAHVARRDDVEDALAEADRLLAADDGLSPDARRMERARLAVRSAAYHRWYGDTEDAATAARDGLALLNRLRRELRSESDRLRARLVFELVCALLDDGELRDAEKAATPVVEEPVRATSAESVSQLMLAVATRVLLPSGQVERGRSLLDQAAWVAERHSLDSVLADALTEVSRLDELEGRTSDALTALRAARAAEQRRLRAMARAARFVLTEVGAGMGAKDVTKQAVAALLRQLAHPAGVPVAMAPQLPEEPAAPRTPRSQLPPPRTSPEPHATPAAGELTGSVVDTDKGTGLLNQEGLVRRLRSVRKGESPVALTVVRFEPNNEGDEEDRGPDTGMMAGLADKVRDIAPENAELARPDGGELAVLLPDTTRDQAEEFAATIRETALESAWLTNTRGKDMSISTGVAQNEDQGDAEGMLTAARDALTPAQQTATEPASAQADPAFASPSPVATQPTTATPPASTATPPTPTVAEPTTPPTQPTPAESHPSLAETAAALQSALSEETPTKPRPTPRSALSEDSPTRPIKAAGTGDLTVGRSILSSLSIPTGSGGRRRADGEPPPGSKTTWPGESAEAPRWTRAERRARESANWPTDPTPTPPSGWPAEPDISQPLRPARAHTPTPGDLPAFGADQTPPRPEGTGKRRAPDPEPDPATAFPSTGYSLEQALGGFTAARAASDQSATTPEARTPGESTPPPAHTSLQAEVPTPSVTPPPATTDPSPAVTESGPTAVQPANTANPPSGLADPPAATAQQAGQPNFTAGQPDIPTGPSSVTAGQPGLTEESSSFAAGQPAAAEPSHFAAGQPGVTAASPSFAAGQPGVPAEPPSFAENPPGIAEPSSFAAGQPAAAEPSHFAADQPGITAASSSFAASQPGVTVEPSNLAANQSGFAAEPSGFAAGQPVITSGPADVPVWRASLIGEQPGGAAEPSSSVAGQQDSAAEGSGIAGERSSDAAGQPGAGESSITVERSGGFAGRAVFIAGPAISADAGESGGRRRAPDSAGSEVSPAADEQGSTYEETRAELARMMSALNSGSLSPQQTVPRPPEPDEVPEPPTRPDIPEPPEPDPIPPVPTEPGPAAPEVPDVPRSEGRSGLMAAFDALTAPVTGEDKTPLRADFSSSTELPSRKPRTSWAQIESAAVVDSPADDLFGRPLPRRTPGTPFKSSLGAAFEEFGAPTKDEPPAAAAPEPTYPEPIGPSPRPDNLPRRDRSDSSTIAGLLAEAMAAYQSTTDADFTSSREPDRFDTLMKHADMSNTGPSHADPNSAGTDPHRADSRHASAGPDYAGLNADLHRAGAGTNNADWHRASAGPHHGDPDNASTAQNDADPHRPGPAQNNADTGPHHPGTSPYDTSRDSAGHCADDVGPDDADGRRSGVPGRHRSPE